MSLQKHTMKSVTIAELATLSQAFTHHWIGKPVASPARDTFMLPLSIVDSGHFKASRPVTKKLVHRLGELAKDGVAAYNLTGFNGTITMRPFTGYSDTLTIDCSQMPETIHVSLRSEERLIPTKLDHLFRLLPDQPLARENAH